MPRAGAPRSSGRWPASVAGQRSRVTVGICTLRREAGLARALEGLDALVFHQVPRPELEVVVVDNEPSARVAALVDAAAPGSSLRLRYVAEPRRGLVHARNAVLDALAPDVDWLAFIDDDEWPEPAWLDELLAVAQATGAQVVSGPVEPCFAAPPPRWAVAGGFYRTGPTADRAPLTSVATNNVLIDAHALRAAGWRFHPAFNRSGGEDEHFFQRALAHGWRMVGATGAVVREEVPAERVSLRWLLRRRFRMGGTLATIDRLLRPGARSYALRLAKGMGRVGLGAAQLLLLLPRGWAGPVTGLANIAWGAGSLATLLGGPALGLYGAPATRPPADRSAA
jgi:succinoglycan biosynthesis protein ExoM